MTSWSLEFKAVLTGMINYGITGKILEPPLSNKSCVANIDKNLYGSTLSLSPSKNIGK